MCDCKVCAREREVRAQLELLPAPQRSFFEGLYDDLTHAELDRDYYHAVLDGSWPSADEVLKSMRAKLAAKATKVAEAPDVAASEG